MKLPISILAVIVAASALRAADPATPEPAPAPAPTPAPAAATAPAVTGGMSGLSFMAGCWEATGGNGKVTFHEMWMAPLGGVMIGGGRTLAQGRTIFTEHFEIREDSTGIAYRAHPQDAPAFVPFKLTKQSDGSVVFENPAHDFPTKISYERLPDGGLRARVDGPANANEKPQEFVYHRISCE